MPRYFTDRRSLEDGPDDDAETAAHERFQGTDAYWDAMYEWADGNLHADADWQFQRTAAYAAAFDLWWGERS